MLAKFFGCTRFVYNYYLSMRKDVYETDKRTLSYKEMAEDLVRLKKEKEFLKEVDSIALQQSLRHLDIAYCNFFKNAKTGYPRFKSRKKGHESYSTVLVNNNVRLEDGCLVLPKLKKVVIRQHRQIPQDFILKSVTVSKTPTDKYYASLLYEYEADIRQISPVRVIGLDYSMSHLFVSSEEEVQVRKNFCTITGVHRKSLPESRGGCHTAKREAAGMENRKNVLPQSMRRSQIRGKTACKKNQGR